MIFMDGGVSVAFQSKTACRSFEIAGSNPVASTKYKETDMKKYLLVKIDPMDPDKKKYFPKTEKGKTKLTNKRSEAKIFNGLSHINLTKDFFNLDNTLKAKRIKLGK